MGIFNPSVANTLPSSWKIASGRLCDVSPEDAMFQLSRQQCRLRFSISGYSWIDAAKPEVFDGLARRFARNKRKITDLGGEDSPICPRYILAEFGSLELRRRRCPLH